MKVMRTDRPHISQLITTCARPLLRPSRLPSRSRCARLHSSRWQHQVGRYASNTQACRPGHRPRHPTRSLWRISRGRATISGHRSSAAAVAQLFAEPRWCQARLAGKASEPFRAAWYIPRTLPSDGWAKNSIGSEQVAAWFSG